MEKNKKKFKIFLEVAKPLNSRFKIIPILYGSLGLYKIIGEKGKANDIDILVPNKFISEKWPEIVEFMANLGFKIKNEKEREFVRKKEIVAFGQQEDLAEQCKINPEFLEISSVKETKFKQLSPEQYLLVYKFMLRDNYRQEKRGNADKNKILFIEKHLQKVQKAAKKNNSRK